jgi:hypothetical protein
VVNLRVQSIVADAARSVKAFGLGVRRRGSRPRLHPGEAIGLFNQLCWIRTGLRESRLVENGGEQEKRDMSNLSGERSSGHDIPPAISLGSQSLLQPRAFLHVGQRSDESSIG